MTVLLCSPAIVSSLSRRILSPSTPIRSVSNFNSILHTPHRFFSLHNSTPSSVWTRRVSRCLCDIILAPGMRNLYALSLIEFWNLRSPNPRSLCVPSTCFPLLWRLMLRLSLPADVGLVSSLFNERFHNFLVFEDVIDFHPIRVYIHRSNWLKLLSCVFFLIPFLEISFELSIWVHLQLNCIMIWCSLWNY